MSKKQNRPIKKPASRLSLCMIVKNEEKFLEGCLESVKGIVDEIVVVDTGSTDRSKEIAVKYGAKLFDFEWVGDFSAARNYSLRQCTGNWILYLDADERLAENQGAALRTLISNPAVCAYNIIIENPHSLHQGNVNQENSYPRLFRKMPGVQFEGKVHEQLSPSLMRQKLTMKQSSIVIQHLGYDQGYDVVKHKAERNLELLRKQLDENPDDAYAQFQIGNSLVVLQRYDEAKPVLELAVTQKGLDASNRASCYNLLAEVEVRRGNLSGAIEFCLKSLELAPGQVMAYWFLSLLHFDLKEYDKAISALKKVEQVLRVPTAQRSNHIASDLDVKMVDLHKRFALTYESAGDYDKAMEYQFHLMEQSKDSDEAVQGFLRCVERSTDSHAAVAALTSLLKRRPERRKLFFPLAWHYRRLNDYAAALKYIDRTIEMEPTNVSAFAFAARWRAEVGDPIEAENLVAIAEQKNLRSFDLHKLGLELSLKRGDVNSAFRHLDLMVQTTDADLSPIKNRLAALAAKMSASPVS